jgi:hypothetical protein
VTVDGEPVQPQRIGDREDVGGSVRDISARHRSRPAIARPIVRDQPDAAPTGILDLSLVEQAGTRRSVEEEDGAPMSVPFLEDPKGPTVRKVHIVIRGRHAGTQQGNPFSIKELWVQPP